VVEPTRTAEDPAWLRKGRLFTSYLPPVWGWFTLVWMRKREYL
jgi:hypothetical protein